MSTQRERILVVEQDPEISDLVARQALKPLGYQVQTANDAGSAIQKSIQLSPDVIIANINLSGLSGKDFLVALSSQGIDIPVIVIGEEGLENEVIRAFRLGATDYLSWPFREAEVISAVERVVKQIRVQRERAHLAQELQRSNQKLEQRIKELTTLFGVGKAVTSTTNQQKLFENILNGALYVTNADRGWLLLRQGKSNQFLLRAYKNLPKSIASRLNKSWDDGISSLVAVSGESLTIHGKALQRFKVSKLGQSVIVIPINVQEKTIGLLVLTRKKPEPFQSNTQKLLEAISDYASISLVNTRLFEALERRASSLKRSVEIAQESERVQSKMLKNISHELQEPLNKLADYIGIIDDDSSRLHKKHKEVFQEIKEKLSELTVVVEAVTVLQAANIPPAFTNINLNAVIKKTTTHFREQAQEKGVSLLTELPSNSLYAFADSNQVESVLNALFSNAIKFNKQGGEVTVRLAQIENGDPHVSIINTGGEIPKKLHQKIFDPFYQINDSTTSQYKGLGIGLTLARKIITAQGGKIWVKSEPDKRTAFHFTLRRPPSALA